MIRTRAERDRSDPASRARRAAPVADPGPEALSNRGVAALLGIQREEGWPGQARGSKNRGGPTEFKAPGGGAVRRHALRGIRFPGMLTDLAIAIVPEGLPRDGTKVDVLVHLHGFEVPGFGTGYEDARPRGRAAPIDSGVMKLEQQMAASGRPVVGVLPQGSATSDFTTGKGKGFDLPGYVTAVFDRLTADQGWGTPPAGTSTDVPPAPGRLLLSGHSGADQPIAEMLAGGTSGDLAGLFLFDTMIVGEKENAKRRQMSGPAAATWRPLFEGRVEAYVLRRMDADLARLLALKHGRDPAAAAQAMRDDVIRQGFRLSVVFRKGGPYDQAGTLLGRAVDGWFAKLDANAVGADVAALLRANYSVRDVPASVEHMDIMASGDAMRHAIEMVPLAAVAPPSGTTTTTPAGSTPPQPAVSRAVAALARAAGNRAAAHALHGAPGQVLQRDAAPATDPVAAEFATFSARGAVEGGLEGFRDIRDIFLSTFGSIAAANTYYRGIRQVPFMGLRPQVHAATLGARLAAAEALLKQKQDAESDTGWYDDLLGQVREAGGFNIRRNRNNRSALSDHSFGWAVDLDAAENPNLHGRFPGRALMAVTGEGVVSGAMGTVAAGGTTQELLAPVEEIRAASQAFEDAFSDEASLEQAMRDYLVMRLKYDVEPDMPILEMVKAAAGQGKAGTKARAELSGRLRDRWTSIPDAEAFQDAEDREQIVANKGWKAWTQEKARRDAARAKAAERQRAERGAAAKKTDQLRKAGKSEDEIRKLVDEPLVASQVKQFEAELSAMADKAAGTLIELWRIYVSSFAGGRTAGRRRVDASPVGTPGSAAAHGFMSVPSRLVAALCGSDGGALDWLGTGLARDFMHFQLTAGQRPPLR
jgi:hypothetical protein